MKTNIIAILLLFGILSSCQKEVGYEEFMAKLKKIPQTNYTEIDCPFEINMDTVSTEKINLELPLKNIGNKNLTDIFIKTTCDCTALEDYPKILNVSKETKIKISIDLDTKGYFCKTVKIYGSFNPLVRSVNIVGYKK